MGNSADIDTILNDLIEELAAIEHERWSHWQVYMHSKCRKEPDGSLIIPVELAERWEKQANTHYSDLTEREKGSDREQINRYLPVIVNALKMRS
jgi:hypothetical protein